MIITKTPYRISFFGGGTDYRPYFEEFGGSVLSTTINRYCYLFIRTLPPFFEHSISAKYSVVETVKEVDELHHPSVRECLRYMDVDDISISHDGDLPARAGLATSSAFTVGLLNGLHALKGEYIDQLSLAKEAIHVEQDLIKENVGVQDQLAVACGGLNRICFTAEGYNVRPIIIHADRKANLSDNLMLFFTGVVRTASEIAKEQINGTKTKLNELHEMSEMVQVGEDILSSDTDLNEFGRLLNHTWELKRSLSSKITTSDIDAIYAKAIQSGAVGGKLLGAGGGGFLLFYVEKDKQENVRKALGQLLEVPFGFENDGSQVIHYTLEE